MKVKSIFGNDLNLVHLNDVYKKIRLNPNCNLDWSELFGYESSSAFSSESVVIVNGNEDEEEEQDGGDGAENGAKDDRMTSLDEVVVFMTTYKFRVGDASGDKARRDVIQAIHYSPDADFFVTVAQKGAVSIWNSKLKLQTCVALKEQSDGWLNCCCYLPNIKRILITAERTLTVWDFRNIKHSSLNNSVHLFFLIYSSFIEAIFNFRNHI